MKYELKVAFETKEELIAFLGGTPAGVKQAAQALNETAQQTITEPAAPVAQPITSQPQQPQQPQQPAKQYTKDELARACATVMDKPEGMQMLQELLAHYKVVSLNDLDPDMYADFADKLRNLGVAV